MDEKKHVLLRLLLSAMAGITVASLATLVAWHTIGPIDYVRVSQWRTELTFSTLEAAIFDYVRNTGALPATLADLRTVEDSWVREPDELLDGWGRPLEYSTDGTHYTIASYGRDGRPGGDGLDSDLSTDKGPSAPTLIQFLTDCPTGGIVGMCVLSGIGTSILCWCIAQPEQLSRDRALTIAFKITVTMIGAFIMGMVLAALHIPSGH